jgi:hypothetical protein
MFARQAPRRKLETGVQSGSSSRSSWLASYGLSVPLRSSLWCGRTDVSGTAVRATLHVVQHSVRGRHCRKTCELRPALSLTTQPHKAVLLVIISLETSGHSQGRASQLVMGPYAPCRPAAAKLHKIGWLQRPRQREATAQTS